MIKYDKVSFFNSWRTAVKLFGVDFGVCFPITVQKCVLHCLLKHAKMVERAERSWVSLHTQLVVFCLRNFWEMD